MKDDDWHKNSPPRDTVRPPAPAGLAKCPTGIAGFDEITCGGLPRGRTSLLCGGAGSGKTLFGVEFLVRGAERYGDPGVFMSFEENAEELADNVRSLGIDLEDLGRRGLLRIDSVRLAGEEIVVAGEFSLDGLFLRLAAAIDAIGARRVVLDTVETLFAAIDDPARLRSELRRLFGWLKERGVSTIITGERTNGRLTRHGLEEFVSDCVVVLDHRASDQISTRWLRIAKYRGSRHGTNEYPFLIGTRGLSMLPITSLALDHAVSAERIASGIAELDAMLAGGFYRGASILVSGSAGTGKTTFAASLVDAACRRGERCLYFAFEESPAQLERNMRSVGIDLAGWQNKQRLRICALRPSHFGLEEHLATMHEAVTDFPPQVVVIDPANGFVQAGSEREARMMLARLVDYLKGAGITTVITALCLTGEDPERHSIGISSVIDSWLVLRLVERNRHLARNLVVLKSRGMAHSNAVRDFVIGDSGFSLLEDGVGGD